MGLDTQKTILPNEFLRCMNPKDRPKGVAGMTTEECQEKCVSKSEKELQKQIENWLRLNGIPVFRQRMDRKSNMPIGTPDLICCVNGYFVAFECKIGDGVPTKEQTECLSSINAASGCARVVFSLVGVKRIIADILKRPLFKIFDAEKK